jgi:ankyrin repeat protein
LEKEANPLFEKDGWNPLLWAACNGNEEIVRILLARNAHLPYLPKQKDSQQEVAQESTEAEEDHDPFQKPKDARKEGKYTPLHWASYKGYFKLVWVLLKIGISPLEIDMYGNTCVHQAAASGNLKILKTYLSRGVDVDIKNARGHSPLDLTTEPNTKQLILTAYKTKACQNPDCKSKFDFKNIRYFCEASAKFFCKKCSINLWVFEAHDSEDKERPVCRSLAV